MAFYFRVYELLLSNDFSRSFESELRANNRESQALGMLELCADFALPANKSDLYEQPEIYLYFSANKIILSKSIKYNKLYFLTQNVNYKP